MKTKKSVKCSNEQRRATNTPKQMKAVPILYTPAKAMEILEKKTTNRKLSDPWIQDIAAQMMRGTFDSHNGETIKFDQHGNLVDGQHRLWAIVESKCSITLWTVYGVSDAAFATIDVGKRRAGRDILSILGQQEATLLAPALVYCYREEMGDIFAGRNPHNSELENLLARHGGIQASLDYVKEFFVYVKKHKGFFSPSAAVYLHYAFCRKDRAIADDFFEKWYTGEGLKRKHPIWHLREWCTSDAASQNVKMKCRHKVALAIKAWNAVRQSKDTVSLLRWSTTEDFPKIL